MTSWLIVLICSIEFSFTPVQANYGSTFDKWTIANLSIDEFSIIFYNVQLGISLYDVENFHINMKHGNVYSPYSPDSLELFVRYRNMFSQWVLSAEVFPIKKLPFSLKFRGSLWARKRIENWIEAEIIQRDPIKFYEYAVYELHPCSYYRISASIAPFHILNSRLLTEIGYLYISYPDIEVKEIKTSFSQYYFSIGTKFLQKSSRSTFPWEISISTGIDGASIGIFALSNIYDESSQKDWQKVTLGTLGIVSGAGAGWFQHYLKKKWLNPEDKLLKRILKKAGAGIIAGLLYETTMFTGYYYVSRDWPQGGDYMVRDFIYFMLVKTGCLGHLCTSIIF